MAWVQLATDFIGRIAWPVVVLAALLLFRKTLTGRLNELMEVEGPGVKARFRQTLDHAEDLRDIAEDIDSSAATDQLVEGQEALPGLDADARSDGGVLAGHYDTVDNPPDEPEPSWLNVPSPGRSWNQHLSAADRAAMSGLPVHEVLELMTGLDLAAAAATINPKQAAQIAWNVLERAAARMIRMFDAKKVTDLIPLLRRTEVFSRSDGALLRKAEELVAYPSKAWEASDRGGERFVRLAAYLLDRLLFAQSDHHLGVLTRELSSEETRWMRAWEERERGRWPQYSDRAKPDTAS